MGTWSVGSGSLDYDGKMTEGIKKDDGKSPWDLVPYDAIEEVVKVLQFGQRKYTARNWEKGIVQSRLFAALQRHMVAWFQKGEDIDPESGLSHLAHAACTILFMLAFVTRERHDLDDRPGHEECITLEEFLEEVEPLVKGTDLAENVD